MATSPNFSWPEPDNTDLVKNGALAIRTAVDAIDSSMGDLKGGTTNQVLTKASGTDMDFTWSTPSTSAGYADNAVLNSAFQIWQRGTSGVAATAAGAYFADRWVVGRGVAGSTGSRQLTNDTTNLPNIQYCARVQRDSGNTSTSAIFLAQSFETINSIPFAGKAVTISYYARAGANYSSASNALTLTAASGTGTDQQILGTYTGTSGFITSTATLTTTWQRFTATGTVSSSANEIAFYFNYTPSGTAGANDYFEITGVQLELGSIATPFHTYAATIQGELAACQRYYWVIGGTDAQFPLVGGYTQNGVQNRFPIPYPVQMRTVPTITLNGTWQFMNFSGISSEMPSTKGFTILATGNASGSAYAYPNSSDDTFTFNAEL